MADVCVTIVLYNSRDHLGDCLAALRADVESGVADVVAVDNASPDDSAALLREQLPQAKVIVSPRNLGFAGGVNLAWPHVSARYWLLLNPDVELDPGALRALVEWMDGSGDVGIASPWLREGRGPEFPGRAFPSITAALTEMLRLHRLLSARRREALLQGPYVVSAPENAPDPGWLPATAVITRRSAVQQTGLLDERFFLYGEDIEWCWRFHLAGWRVAAAPVGGGTHHASGSSRRTWDELSVQERIAVGTLEAGRRMRGSQWARAFGYLVSLSLWVEAKHPGRSAERRHRARVASRAWRRAIRAR
jgi:N-acetylglucosaminyl-diphospho-decaprenol L-rhamnosyltransferase